MSALPHNADPVDLLRWVAANPNQPFDPTMVVSLSTGHESDWEWQAVIAQMEDLRRQNFITKLKQDPWGSTYWTVTSAGKDELERVESPKAGTVESPKLQPPAAVATPIKLPPEPAAPNLKTEPETRAEPKSTESESRPWTRGEKLAFWGVMLALGCFVAALLVVPEVRRWAGLDKPDVKTNVTNSVPADSKPVEQGGEPKPDQTKSTFESAPTPKQQLGSRVGTGITASATGVASGRTLQVVDGSGKPLPGAEILLVWSDGTHLHNVTGGDGLARLDPFPPTTKAPSVYCAHEGFTHYYRRDYDFSHRLVIMMTTKPNGGSVIFAEGTGYIPGLDGRLNPILDAQGRTYIYAENISVGDGKPQPVDFTTSHPFQVKDSHGHSFEIEVAVIIGRSSLIEYRRIFH